jgi:hypothetical protein
LRLPLINDLLPWHSSRTGDRFNRAGAQHCTLHFDQKTLILTREFR